MSEPSREKKPYDIVVRLGMWITVAAALVWVGGETYKVIQSYVPWVLGIGVVVLVMGVVLQFRKGQPAAKK